MLVNGIWTIKASGLAHGSKALIGNYDRFRDFIATKNYVTEWKQTAFNINILPNYP